MAAIGPLASDEASKNVGKRSWLFLASFCAIIGAPFDNKSTPPRAQPQISNTKYFSSDIQAIL